MSIQCRVKLLARLATFLLTFSLALFFVNLFVRPLMHTIDAPPAAPPAPISIFDDQASSKIVSYKAQLVSLDFLSGKAYATLALKHTATKDSAPEKIWIRIGFFAPDDAARKVWTSEPVEVRDPFRASDTNTLTVSGECFPCVDANAPAGGYYARIFVSTVPENSLRVREELTNFDLADAIPVLVQNKREAAHR